MKKAWQLFWSFFRIGAFTFGGGYAMLTMIQNEICERKKWATEDEIIDCFTISQCTPGVIAVNTATNIGFKQDGYKGAVAATLGVITPSLIIIILIASLLDNFSDNIYVTRALNGIRVIVLIFILDAVIKFWKSGIKNTAGFIVFAVSLVLSLFAKVSSVYIVIFALIFSIVLYMFNKCKEKRTMNTKEDNDGKNS
ncbi:MAG: chromate transporter [Lachnospiraceae bacterium]|nr:chromate transporter [Lachnospiraceae bacterium]